MMKTLNLIKQINILTEGAMSAAQLAKINSTTKKMRPEILLDLINSNADIQLTKGRVIKIDKVKSKEFIKILKISDMEDMEDALSPGGKYFDIIVDTEGNKYKVTALEKADYFGGGTGSNKPTAITTGHQESAQSMAIAVSLMTRRKLKPEDITLANFKKAAAKYDTTSSPEEAFAAINNPAWIKSLINTTQELSKKVKLTGMVIHRQSSWVKALNDLYTEVNVSADGGKEFDQIDKWNPSDIWAVKKGAKPPSDIKTLAALNSWVERMFEEGTVIGISLKFTPDSTQSKVYNLENDVDDIMDLSITDLLVSKTNKLFNSKQASIMFEDANSISSIMNEKSSEMAVRSFSATGDLSGEIVGKYAAGGKVSRNQLNRIFRDDLKVKDIITHRKDLSPMLNKEFKSDKEKYYKKIFDKIIAMAKTINPTIANAAKKNFSELAKTLDFNRLATKYQAVETLAILKTVSKKKQAIFIQKAFQYASSRSDLSSVYIKVW